MGAGHFLNRAVDKHPYGSGPQLSFVLIPLGIRGTEVLQVEAVIYSNLSAGGLESGCNALGFFFLKEWSVQGFF